MCPSVRWKRFDNNVSDVGVLRVAAGFVDSANTIAQRGPIGNTPRPSVVLLSAVDLAGTAGTRLRRGVRINAGAVGAGTSGGLLGCVTRTHFICHCERPSTSSARAGISMRLNTRRRTAVATTTRLPRYARNDKVRTHEGQRRIDGGRTSVWDESGHIHRARPRTRRCVGGRLARQRAHRVPGRQHYWFQIQGLLQVRGEIV